jgi:hypothetical protein
VGLRGLRTALTHHVGKHYDLQKGSEPIRIVVLGLDYGDGSVGVNIDERTQSIAGQAWKDSFKDRNPHLKGTTSILRLLLGREPGEDTDGERLFLDTDTHIFDAFALVDAVMCSALPYPRQGPHSASSQITDVMRENCSIHLRHTLRILDPTVIVTQGAKAREALGRAYKGESAFPWWQMGVQSVQLNDRFVNIVSFNHPSARGESGWSSTKSRYLHETIIPEVRKHFPVAT